MSWAQPYVGLPFASRGRSPAGYDCWGLVQRIYHEQLSLDLPSYADRYYSTEESVAISRTIYREKQEKWLAIAPEAVQPFDLIVIKMRGVAMHVGVVVTPGTMLHIIEGINATIEPYHTLRWQQSIAGFYRHPSRA